MCAPALPRLASAGIHFTTPVFLRPEKSDAAPERPSTLRRWLGMGPSSGGDVAQGQAALVGAVAQYELVGLYLVAGEAALLGRKQ